MRYGNGIIKGNSGNGLDTPRTMAIAHAFAAILKEYGKGLTPKVALSYDHHPISQSLVPLVSQAMQLGGADVYNALSGPEDYLTFVVGEQLMDAGLYITSRESHEDIALVFKGPDADQLEDPDLHTILERSANERPNKIALGKEVQHPRRKEYVEFIARVLKGYGGWPPLPDHGLSLVADMTGSEAGGMLFASIHEMGIADAINFYPLMVHGTGGQPPPLQDRLTALREKVLTLKADMGLTWAADGLRMLVIDSRGDGVHPFHVGALLGACAAARYPDADIVTDQRAGLAMLNSADMGSVSMVPALPGTVEATMRGCGASFGFNPSSNFYFREMWWGPSGVLAALILSHMAYLCPKGMQEAFDNMQSAYPCAGPIDVPTENAVRLNRVFNTAIKNAGTTLSYRSEITADGSVLLRSTLPEKDWRASLTPLGAHIQLHVEGGVGSTSIEVESLAQVLSDAITTVEKEGNTA